MIHSLARASARSRTAVAGLATLTLLGTGCGSEPPGAPPLRLTERSQGVRVESAVGLDAAGADPLAGAELCYDARHGDAEPATGFRHRAAWVRPVLFDDEEAAEPGAVEAALVPLEPKRRVLVRAHRAAAAASDDRLFVLELSFEPTPAELADPAYAEELFRQIGTFVRELTPVPPADAPEGSPHSSGDEQRLETTFVPHPTTTGVLVGRAGELTEPVRFEVRQLSARGGWLYASGRPGRAPWVRSVTAQRDTREALVCEVGGSFTFDVWVPGGRPRLTTAITTLFASPDRSLEVEVDVRGDDGTSHHGRRFTAPPRGWAELEVDLEPFAGQRVTVTLAASEPTPSEALVAFGAPCVESVDPRERLDVVLISLDTLRADRSSAYGYDAETTPTLARLAAESVVFENAITTAPWTLPAHISIFSGQYPDRHRVHGQHSHLAAETPWIAEEFQRAGYRTLAFTGSGYVNPEFGFARGFDRYAFTDPSFPPPEWLRRRRAIGIAQGPPNVQPPRTRVELLERLREPRRAPRFVFVHTYAAHNYAAGPEDLRALGAERDDVDELVTGVDTNALNRRLDELPDGPEADRLRERASFLYDASLRVADRLVADVLDALERADRLEHTVVVVLSDHGEELFERGNIGHGGSVYEEMVRVPLMIRLPGASPARVPNVVSLVDVAPTLRELCGLPSPAEPGREDGRSLVPLLHGESLPPRPALARGDRRDLVFRCLRGADFKFVLEERPAETPRTRLFALDADPNEVVDRSDEQAARTDELAETLRGTVERLEALGPHRVEAELSGDVLENLKELGYLGD